ncbi:Protein of unknown function [Tistlia consotensis]|uniref:Adenylate cyclase, class 3 n=1 Tax=Tistlia consotensis USBA 355 TaxID=560819 RepID=A0A1Y6BLQ8_9PROT|nr:DUF2652 domain-containing protein [Tistlia consotensis]SMF09745.1 Protein of unknown function [Tistlia consotensis USBA 355]SNR34275.1 Protein of unknown function [Tistlia consotensis]
MNGMMGGGMMGGGVWGMPLGAALPIGLLLVLLLALLVVALALARRVSQRLDERIGAGVARRLTRRRPPPAADSGTFEALLLIPDITGYTHFMELSRFALGHAQYLVSELLVAMIEAGGEQLRTLKIEGDAVFMYAPLQPGDDEPDRLGRLVVAVLAAFYRRQRELLRINSCGCAACGALPDLDIKAVADCGAVLFDAVADRQEISGLPVIAVHRLLKSTVGQPHYLLLTEAAAARVRPALAGPPRRMAQQVRGLPDAACLVFGFDPAELAGPEQPAPPAGPLERLGDIRRKLGSSLHALRHRGRSPGPQLRS